VQVTDHPAITILKELGNNSFIATSGAKDFVTSDNPQPRLTMRLPSNRTKKRGTHIEISQLPTDNYQMVFFKGKRGRPGERDIIAVDRNVPQSGIRASFEALTGIRPPIG
jgi:hypothetical protein